MAKKKKHNRKKSTYKVRAKQQATPASQAAVVPKDDSLEVVAPAVPTKSAKKQGDDTTEVVALRARKEVRHSLLLAVVILAGLIGLWCLFTFTPIGSQVFKLFDL